MSASVTPCAPGRPLEPLDEPSLGGAVRLLKGFADPTRLRLLWLLSGDETCVHVLVEALGMTQSAVSHQLRLLRDARLVRARKEGRHVYYRLADEHVRALLYNAVRHAREVDGTGPGRRP